MKLTPKFLAVALATSLVAAGAAQADTVIETFDNFTPSALFDWSDAITTSGPTSYTVIDTGYGSGYKDVEPKIDGTGNNYIQMTVDLDGGPSGPIIALVDGDGTFDTYAWYGTPVGHHVLTMPLHNNPDFDFSTIDFFHIQDDPGGFGGFYSIEFEDLRLRVALPEPATASIAGLGLVGLASLRRRRSA